MTRTFTELVSLGLLFCGSFSIIVGIVQQKRGSASKARTVAVVFSGLLWIVLSTGLMFGGGPELITIVCLLALIPLLVMVRHKATASQ